MEAKGRKMLSAAAAPAAIFDGWTVTAVSRRRLFFFLLPPFLLFLLSPYSTAVARPISTRVAATAVVATGTTFSLLFFHWATLERRHWNWCNDDVNRPFFLLSLSLSFLSSYIHCCLVLDSLLRLAESIFLFLLLLLTSLFSSRFHLCL